MFESKSLSVWEWPLVANKDFEKLLTTFFGPSQPKVINGPTKDTFPKVEMEVVDGNLVIQAALAGYPKDNLSIKVEDDTITIKGEKTSDEKSLFASRAFTWSRTDTAHCWQMEQAKAEYKDGMLTITVPHRASKSSKQVDII